MTNYPYQVISIDPNVPPTPILRVSLFNPVRNGDSQADRLYELDAFLDTGADCTLIPFRSGIDPSIAIFGSQVSSPGRRWCHDDWFFMPDRALVWRNSVSIIGNSCL